MHRVGRIGHRRRDYLDFRDLSTVAGVTDVTSGTRALETSRRDDSLNFHEDPSKDAFLVINEPFPSMQV